MGIKFFETYCCGNTEDKNLLEGEIKTQN